MRRKLLSGSFNSRLLFKVKKVAKPNKTNDPVARYTGIGVALGTAFGLAFGAAFDDAGTGLALGLALGVATGAGIGTRLKKKQEAEDLHK